MRHLYNQKVAQDEVWDVDEEDEEAFRLGLVEQLENNNTPFDVKRFQEELNKELGVFEKGEKYSYVKDLKEAYQESLRVPLNERIFDSIPAHYFWDIKRPQIKFPVARMNRYNPYRGKEYDNFFEARDAEEYFYRQEKKNNTENAVSLHRRY